MEISKTQVQIDRGNSFYESNQPYSLFLLTIFFSIYHKCAKFHGVQKKEGLQSKSWQDFRAATMDIIFG